MGEWPRRRRDAGVGGPHPHLTGSALGENAVTPWPPPRSLPSGRGLAAAHDAIAIAFGHVDPGLLVGVDLRGSGAGIVAGRGAVVLAGLGEAVALLGFEGRGRRRAALRHNKT